MRVLLIEDEADLALALSRVLSRRGLQVETCGDGLDALSVLQRSRFDALVLDVSLPGMDGLQVLNRLRLRDDRTPVLLLTARGSVGDRVTGLNAGADDYLPKPFDLDELEARIRALLRRARADERTRCGELLWDRASGLVYRDDKPLDLSARESALLNTLLVSLGKAVTRDRLHRLVFDGHASVQPEALEVLVHRLRKKLAGTGVAIMTLRGLGYLLHTEPPSA